MIEIKRVSPLELGNCTACASRIALVYDISLSSGGHQWVVIRLCNACIGTLLHELRLKGWRQAR